MNFRDLCILDRVSRGLCAQGLLKRRCVVFLKVVQYRCHCRSSVSGGTWHTSAAAATAAAAATDGKPAGARSSSSTAAGRHDRLGLPGRNEVLEARYALRAGATIDLDGEALGAESDVHLSCWCWRPVLLVLDGWLLSSPAAPVHGNRQGLPYLS